MTQDDMIGLALLAIAEGDSQLIFVYNMEELGYSCPDAQKAFKRAEILYACGERGNYILKIGCAI